MQPYFSSDHSIGESILTLDAPEIDRETKEILPIDLDSPVPIFAIAHQYNIARPLIIDSDISGFWKLYKNAESSGQKYTYGIKIAVCQDMDDKTPEQESTESNIIIIFKNSRAYYDMVPLYTEASTRGMTAKCRRMDWKTLKKYWTGNFKLAVPFYSSFIARNLLKFGSVALPEFGDVQPTFFIQRQGLPFDDILEQATKSYCKENNYKSIEAHHCYYHKDEDIKAYLTFRCIQDRSTLDKPEQSHFCSDGFSFESYVRKTSQVATPKKKIS